MNVFEAGLDGSIEHQIVLAQQEMSSVILPLPPIANKTKSYLILSYLISLATYFFTWLMTTYFLLDWWLPIWSLIDGHWLHPTQPLKPSMIDGNTLILTFRSNWQGALKEAGRGTYNGL